MRIQFGVVNNPELRGFMEISSALFHALLAGFVITLRTKEGTKHRVRPIGYTTQVTNSGGGGNLNLYTEEMEQDVMTFEEVQEETAAPIAKPVEVQGGGSPFTHKSQP